MKKAKVKVDMYMRKNLVMLVLSVLLVMHMVPASAFAKTTDAKKGQQISQIRITEEQKKEINQYVSEKTGSKVDQIEHGSRQNDELLNIEQQSGHENDSETQTNKKRYKGKSVAFYGDSLTEKGFTCTKGYHEWITELMELGTYENYAVHGYTLKDIYHAIKENTTDADIIFIMGGTNDQAQSISYGTYSDTTEDTTCGAIYQICEYLKKHYSDREIIFITPPYQTRYPHKQGITYDQIGDAIKHYCKGYGFKVYDNGERSGINDETIDQMTYDRCHWTDKTHDRIGKAIAAWLIEQ